MGFHRASSGNPCQCSSRASSGKVRSLRPFCFLRTPSCYPVEIRIFFGLITLLRTNLGDTLHRVNRAKMLFIESSENREAVVALLNTVWIGCWIMVNVLTEKLNAEIHVLPAVENVLMPDNINFRSEDCICGTTSSANVCLLRVCVSCRKSLQLTCICNIPERCIF